MKISNLISTALALTALSSCGGAPQQEDIKALADRVFAVAEQQLPLIEQNLPDDRAPKTIARDSTLATSDLGWWCSGFYPGSLWLVYERNGNADIRRMAEKNTLKLSNLLSHHTDHDIGFQINCSYGNALRITGDTVWEPMIVASAHRLASRFNPVTGAIKSWDFVDRGRDWQWPVIIDNMMNLELLMNASHLSGDASLADVAVTHATTTLNNHFRDDYSTFHLVDYDTITGNARLHHTVQGLADESAWARGQAWSVYGYTMMARETGSAEFLSQAEGVARYLLGRLPDDGIPYWDFDSPKIPDDLRDASAGAIMASAFAELSTLTADAELSARLLAMAELQVRTLASPDYLAAPGTNAGFLIRHCVGHIPNGTEIDVPLTYADYYFLEALSRLEQIHDLGLLRQRFTSAALRPEAPVDDGYVISLLNSLQADGSWSDINYADTRNVAFQNAQHLAHMVAMARAYRLPSSSLYADKALLEGLLRAIDFWTANDFICENWWNNEIGTPTAMIQLLYLVDADLGAERSRRMLAIAGRANMKAQGARPSGDRMKIASLYTKAALWRRDFNTVSAMIRFMGNEMRYYDDETFQRIQDQNPQYFKGGRGLQADLSFHHRDDRVNNTLTYGEGHALAFCEWADFIADTRFRFSDEAIRLMVDYYLDGMCRQMVYGLQSDPGVMNRDMARPSTGRQLADPGIARTLCRISDYRRDELRNLIDLREGRKTPVPSFAKTFFCTEHFVFQRPTYYASVRMFSTRNANMEMPYNGEGFTNHYRADGANYLSVTGAEYAGIYPTFDFRRVPGTTVLQADTMPAENQLQQWGLTDYVGGVDDGLYGAAAFDFVSPIDHVSAHKAWFFFDDAYLCLGTDISHKGEGHVFTTVNQCYLDGEVTSASADDGHLRWVNHSNVGYVFPEDGDVHVSSGNVSGSWARLNRQTTISTDSITNPMFCLYLDHGANPHDASYAYIVAPGRTPAQTELLAASSGISIIANTSRIQAAARHDDGIAYAALYAPGTFRINGSISITSDVPLMLLAHFTDSTLTSLTVSDPTHNSTSARLTVSASGTTSTHIVILPSGQLSGSSTNVLLCQ